jgi:DNA-binding transcriptional MerR regulator
MPKIVVETFLINEAAGLSGLTASMLNYLCREEVLVPSNRGRRGRGSPRKYSFGDVVMLRALAHLLEAGVSVKRLKKALKSLRPQHKNISRLSLPAQYLVTNGHEVFLQEKENLLDMDGSGQMSFTFVLELRDVREDVFRLERKYADGRG